MNMLGQHPSSATGQSRRACRVWRELILAVFLLGQSTQLAARTLHPLSLCDHECRIPCQGPPLPSQPSATY
ncbi:hypothetical protein EDD21DRAFT_385883 [Dissophora ornata]|nr:hypothetical protein EDD21DRAFT_385883 [Dissophora ornata]